MTPKRFLTITLLSVWLSLVLAEPAHAYLDLGAGSYACQIFLAALMGVGFLIKIYFGRIKTFLYGLVSKCSKR